MILEKGIGNTIHELILFGREELRQAGIEEAQQECDRILMKFLGCSRTEIYLKKHKLMKTEVKENFLTVLEKRKRRIPLGYLLQEADFWKETLYVNENCLIPRPETEILVENVLQVIRGSKKERFSFLDLGAGSGAIAVAIMNAFEAVYGTLSDISEEALKVATKNLKKYSLTSRAKVVQGDLFEPFSNDEKWDLIVSNPPYLTSWDMKKLQPELTFEPKEALDGGIDGLDFYQKIVSEAKGHLVPGGTVAVEVGQGQADIVSKWFRESGYDNIQLFKDYLQVQRVIMAQRNS
ncbi:MAG TPA: peptide chain release factor N(5)-glutamine methyltransferase [Candidatus Omnitrophota bacterium]|nr:peptide chain release factor N(5)-glutamine methyltransferase [Candidatus Omnitrophota bacterium]